jgi:hypothetical protein
VRGKRLLQSVILAVLWTGVVTSGGAQTASRAKPDSATLGYPMEFDSVEVYLRSLIPPDGRNNVRNLELSADGFNLKVDADVRIGSLSGFEMFQALGWAHVTGRGPVRVLRPGLIGWEIQSMQINGQNIAAALWAPLIRRSTRRSDTVLPFQVGAWVKRVEVEPRRLMLY